jgi:hypothetical protein
LGSGATFPGTHSVRLAVDVQILPETEQDNSAPIRISGHPKTCPIDVGAKPYYEIVNKNDASGSNLFGGSTFPSGAAASKNMIPTS